MSKARARRRAVRWARYFNRYGYLDQVTCGGWAPRHLMRDHPRAWFRVRRQAKKKWSAQ